MAEKLSEIIYKSVRDEIVNGILDSKVFLSESEVAAKYGVSKAPVRDALHLLCKEGYLISYPRKGYMVNSYTIEEYEKIREVRAHIEQLCITLAVENATDSEINSLRETISDDSMELNPYKTNNTRFHTRLAEISHNPYLTEILYKLLGISARIAIKTHADPARHENIINALSERNSQKALEYLDIDLNSDF